MLTLIFDRFGRQSVLLPGWIGWIKISRKHDVQPDVTPKNVVAAEVKKLVHSASENEILYSVTE
jgi:hypothetical protein